MPTLETTESRFQNALASLTPELLAMPETQIKRRARLDPSDAFLIAWASSERLGAYREALVALCGARAGELVDALPTVAFAARQADVEALRNERSEDLTTVYEPVHAAHRLLLTDCESLVNRGVLPARALDNARSTQGYQATLDSLQVLVSLVRAEWSRIESRTQITREDLSRADQAAIELAYALSQRAPGGPAPMSAELRVRALSKLVTTYEEIRRMVSYLRWYEGDAEALAPSFYAGRGARKTSSAPTDDDASPSPVLPQTPGPVNGSGPFAA